MAATDYYSLGYEMLSAVVTGKRFTKSRSVAGAGLSVLPSSAIIFIRFAVLLCQGGRYKKAK
jgi:hypothetical protein